MDLDILLFGLRILSALLLLGFVALLGYLSFRDLEEVSGVAPAAARLGGILRIVATETGNPPLQTEFTLAPVTSIGRSLSSTVVIEDGYASNNHALLVKRGKQWLLEDLDSRNGTLLNQIAVTEPTVVSSGDIIMIGDTQLKVEL